MARQIHHRVGHLVEITGIPRVLYGRLGINPAVARYDQETARKAFHVVLHRIGNAHLGQTEVGLKHQCHVAGKTTFHGTTQLKGRLVYAHCRFGELRVDVESNRRQTPGIRDRLEKRRDCVSMRAGTDVRRRVSEFNEQ